MATMATGAFCRSMSSAASSCWSPTCGRATGAAATACAWAILKLLVARSREAWPEVHLIVRGDSGFCRWRMLHWCEWASVDYIIGLARNPRLEKLGAPLMAEAQAAYAAASQKQRRLPDRACGCDVGPVAAGHREGGVQRAGDQSALRHHQPAGRSAGALRPRLLRARRDGEPDQGAATRAL